MCSSDLTMIMSRLCRHPLRPRPLQHTLTAALHPTHQSRPLSQLHFISLLQITHTWHVPTYTPHSLHSDVWSRRYTGKVNARDGQPHESLIAPEIPPAVYQPLRVPVRLASISARFLVRCLPRQRAQCLLDLTPALPRARDHDLRSYVTFLSGYEPYSSVPRPCGELNRVRLCSLVCLHSCLEIVLSLVIRLWLPLCLLIHPVCVLLPCALAVCPNNPCSVENRAATFRDVRTTTIIQTLNKTLKKTMGHYNHF